MSDRNSKKILVVGSINMDVVVRAEQIPRPGQTIMGSELLNSPGGKGANQAVAAARLGGDCAILGAIGCDAFGDQLIAALSGSGVDVSLVARRDGVASGAAIITVAASGENSIVVSGGANLTLMPEDVFGAKSAFEQADIVLVQLEVPLETSLAAIEMAKKYGCKTVVDPAPARGDLPEELFSVDIISPNTSEAEIISDSPAGSLDAEAAARLLVSRGAKSAVMKLGADGSLVYDGSDVNSGPIHVPPFKVDVIDTTAAGDCFTAALAVAVAGGCDLSTAARFANAAGALACTVLGAQKSAPTFEQVKTLLA